MIRELTQIKHTDVNDFQVPLQTGFLHDKSGSAPITFFIDTCNSDANEQFFQVTNTSSSKYRIE